MKTCWRRSSGSSASNARRRSRAQVVVGAWATTKSTAWPTERILAACFVGHLHAVGVLELLDERVEVQRVGLQVLLEARRLVDARGIDLELVGEMRLDEAEDLFAGHGEATVEGDPDSRAGRSACAASSAACVRPTTSPSTAAGGEQDRLRDAAAAEAPVRHHAEPAQARAGRRRPALSGSITSRNSSSAGRSSRPPALARRDERRRRRGSGAASPPRRPPSA